MREMECFHLHSSAMGQALPSEHCTDSRLLAPSRAATLTRGSEKSCTLQGAQLSSSAFKNNGKQLTGFFHLIFQCAHPTW